MNNHFYALLVHQEKSPMESLKTALKELPVDTCSVQSLDEARRLIPQTHPHVVFTDTTLPDGSWKDVIHLAEESEAAVNVIVVGGKLDIEFYISALENGAFDFVLPPFEHDSLDFVVKSAGEDARHRRHNMARLAVA
jgi:DNA-binding NtrC family response regulator